MHLGPRCVFFLISTYFLIHSSHQNPFTPPFDPSTPFRPTRTPGYLQTPSTTFLHPSTPLFELYSPIYTHQHPFSNPCNPVSTRFEPQPTYFEPQPHILNPQTLFPWILTSQPHNSSPSHAFALPSMDFEPQLAFRPQPYVATPNHVSRPSTTYFKPPATYFEPQPRIWNPQTRIVPHHHVCTPSLTLRPPSLTFGPPASVSTHHHPF